MDMSILRIRQRLSEQHHREAVRLPHKSDVGANEPQESAAGTLQFDKLTLGSKCLNNFRKRQQLDSSRRQHHEPGNFKQTPL